MQGQQVGWQVSPRLTTYRRGLGSRKDHHAIGAVFRMEAIPLRIKPLQVLEILRAVIRHPASEKTAGLFAKECDELGLALVHGVDMVLLFAGADFFSPSENKAAMEAPMLDALASYLACEAHTCRSCFDAAERCPECCGNVELVREAKRLKAKASRSLLFSPMRFIGSADSTSGPAWNGTGLKFEEQLDRDSFFALHRNFSTIVGNTSVLRGWVNNSISD